MMEIGVREGDKKLNLPISPFPNPYIFWRYFHDKNEEKAH
jgi:hypothetical protein